MNDRLPGSFRQAPAKSGFEQVHLARRFGASNLVKTPFSRHRESQINLGDTDSYTCAGADERRRLHEERKRVKWQSIGRNSQNRLGV
jgi:hypothetical protein